MPVGACRESGDIILLADHLPKWPPAAVVVDNLALCIDADHATTLSFWLQQELWWPCMAIGFNKCGEQQSQGGSTCMKGSHWGILIQTWPP